MKIKRSPPVSILIVFPGSCYFCAYLLLTLTLYNLSISEIISRYRGLWSIEESFRISKHDLKMRPIYHWTPERISGHILICFIAYALVRQAMYRISLQYEPMSFERIRNELLHAQASILIDKATRRKSLLPSKTTPVQKKLYHIFGLKRSEVPRRMT